MTEKEKGRAEIGQGNANDVVREMVGEVLPVVKHTPVLAGVCATDPFRDIPRFLRELKDMGIVGVQV
jgi:predicted TIM-barrel enzyme